MRLNNDGRLLLSSFIDHHTPYDSWHHPNPSTAWTSSPVPVSMTLFESVTIRTGHGGSELQQQDECYVFFHISISSFFDRHALTAFQCHQLASTCLFFRVVDSCVDNQDLTYSELIPEGETLIRKWPELLWISPDV